jgi:hypothetical protein
MQNSDPLLKTSTERDIDQTFAALEKITRAEKALLDCWRIANLECDSKGIEYQLADILSQASAQIGSLRFEHHQHLNELHQDLK